MNDTLRYDPVQRFLMGGSTLGEMRQCVDGDWVSYEDYERVVRERDEAHAATRLASQLGQQLLAQRTEERDHALREREALKTELDAISCALGYDDAWQDKSLSEAVTVLRNQRAEARQLAENYRDGWSKHAFPSLAPKRLARLPWEEWS